MDSTRKTKIAKPSKMSDNHESQNDLPCADDVTWKECYEYLDDYVLNIGQDPDDYDMLTASKTLYAYVHAHADKLDAQARPIGWLPLEVIEPQCRRVGITGLRKLA